MCVACQKYPAIIRVCALCIEESKVKGFYLSSRYVVDEIGKSNQSVPPPPPARGAGCLKSSKVGNTLLADGARLLTGLFLAQWPILCDSNIIHPLLLSLSIGIIFIEFILNLFKYLY